MGGHRGCRDRPGPARRHPHRRLRRRGQPGLRLRRGHRRRRCRGLRHQRGVDVAAVRAHRLHPGPGRPRAHRGHRLLLVAGRPAPGRAGAAPRRGGPGAGRWRHGDGHAEHVRRVQPAGRAGPRRALPLVLGRGRRHRLVRGRRHAAGRAAQRRPPARPRRACGGARHGGQPGRCLERADRSQRLGAATGHPRRAGRRRHRPRGRGPGRGARHRHQTGRPDRGRSRAGHLRPGPRPGAPGAAGLAEVQHRAHPVGRRGRRDHQGGRGDPARHHAPHLVRREALTRGQLVGGRGVAAGLAAALAAGREPAPGRGFRVRHRRHQRPHHHRGSQRRAGPG